MPNAPDPLPPDSLPRPGGAAPTVIVADADADMRFHLARCLAGQGRVERAETGAEVLRLARATPPRLVVCDGSLPDLDGDALCLALRAEPATHAVPVLVVSADPSAPSCADGVLGKPFNAASLRRQAGALLRTPA